MSRRHQRGVALITAIVLVALATVLAVAIGFNTALTARRGAGSAAVEQGLQFALGAEALAAYVLMEDLRSNAAPRSPGTGGGTPPPPAQADTPADAWTQPYGPVEIAPQVALEAQLEDEQGKFNLNTLVDPTGKVDEDAVLIFRQLLRKLDLEPKWADQMADWLDPDSTDARPAGGEDALYLSQRPGYRAANGPVTSPSELMQLPDFGRERYLKLLPFVTALPPENQRRINICFARQELLDALVSAMTGSDYTEYRSQPLEQFTQRRSGSCYPDMTLLGSAIPADKKQTFDNWATTRSDHFRLRTWVTIGGTRFTLYSLLHRGSTGQNPTVETLLRTFGTE